MTGVSSPLIRSRLPRWQCVDASEESPRSRSPKADVSRIGQPLWLWRTPSGRRRLFTSPRAALVGGGRLGCLQMSLSFRQRLRVGGRWRGTAVPAATQIQLALAAARDAHQVRSLLCGVHAPYRTLVATRKVLGRRVGLRLVTAD